MDGVSKNQVGGISNRYGAEPEVFILHKVSNTGVLHVVLYQQSGVPMSHLGAAIQCPQIPFLCTSLFVSHCHPSTYLPTKKNGSEIL